MTSVALGNMNNEITVSQQIKNANNDCKQEIVKPMVQVNTTEANNGNEKLNTALKCLAAVGIAGLAVTLGIKGLKPKHIKSKNCLNLPNTIIENSQRLLPEAKNTVGLISSTVTDTLSRQSKVIENVSSTATAALNSSGKVKQMFTFQGMSAQQIANAYKSGNKAIFRELAHYAHPDARNYNEAYADLYKSVVAMV